MRVHFQVSAGTPSAAGDGSLDHRVTLTCLGELLHMGHSEIEGSITVWRQDDAVSRRVEMDPDLVSAVQDLGEAAASEIFANLTAGRDADGDTLEIEDDPDEDHAQPVQASLRDLYPSDCPDRD